MNKIDIVLGLGFGDEGKGNVVNALATKDSLVVRFNGGHQAAHNVVNGATSHIFSTFGAGTLKGARTYISEFCTMYPIAFMNERGLLIDKEVTPVIYVNENTMITTPFDLLMQENARENQEHGTVGVGFGTTIQRNEDGFRIYARDLMFPEILSTKLKMINDYYYPTDIFDEGNQLMIRWMHDAVKMAQHIILVQSIHNLPEYFNHVIFEGAQGVMLDKDYGFFPHVTRSNTTAKNVFKILAPYSSKLYALTVYHVTRAYQTRHGAGPMFNNPDVKVFQEEIEETNLDNGIQGKFRKLKLNYDGLKYALQCSKNEISISADYKLVVTCQDHLIKPLNKQFMARTLGIVDRSSILFSFSPEMKIDR